MSSLTSDIGGRNYIIDGFSGALDVFRRIKVALETDGFSVSLPENKGSSGSEPAQTIEVIGIGKVFLTGSINSRTLIVELPIETPVYG